MARSTVFVLFYFLSLTAQAQISFSSTLYCSYQKAQFLTDEKSQSFTNSVPIKWSFDNLAGESPNYSSAGDTGSVMKVTFDYGVILYLPFATGTHTFTLWNNGQSIWAKQLTFMNIINAQQFIGYCEN